MSGESGRSATERPRVGLIGIGVQKAASTWLYRCLAESPEIGVARPNDVGQKELNFFNRFYERGFAWYEGLFPEVRSVQMEFSVLYFHDLDVPARLHRYNPDARLLLCLRDPVSRAYSHHRHEFRKGRLTPDRYDFWSALSTNPSYVELGRYATHLERWLEYFDLSRIHVVFHEDVSQHPDTVLREARGFAGVDPDFDATLTHRQVNGPSRKKSDVAERAVRASSRLVKGALGSAAHGAFKSTGIGAFVRSLNQEVVDESAVPPLTDEGRQRLRAVFADEVTRLEALLDRDLSAWR